MTTLASPIDLLSAVPFMIGYQPSDSLVIIGLRKESVELAMRIDFPMSVDIEQNMTLVDHLRRNEIEETLLVSYIPDSVSDADVVIKALSESLESANFPLRESLIVVANRWRSLICADALCCPIEGQPLPAFEQARVTAEQISLGNPLPYRNVEDLRQSLERFEVDEELESAITSIPEDADSETAQKRRQEGAEALIDFINDFESDGICRDKKLIAIILVRMKDLQVRDFALGSVTYERLNLYFDAYKWLMRMAPQNYVAPIATVFSAVCYEKGEGVMAQRVLDRALSDDPDYALAHLFRQFFATGRKPEIFADMRKELHPKVCDAIFSGTLQR